MTLGCGSAAVKPSLSEASDMATLQLARSLHRSNPVPMIAKKPSVYSIPMGSQIAAVPIRIYIRVVFETVILIAPNLDTKRCNASRVKRSNHLKSDIAVNTRLIRSECSQGNPMRAQEQLGPFEPLQWCHFFLCSDA